MQFYSEYENCYQAAQVADVSSVLRIQNLQIALEKAVGDISLLQQNLAFVIQIKEELEAELAVRDQRQKAVIQECERQLEKKKKEMESVRLREAQLVELLQDTKESLQNMQLSSRQRQDQVRKMKKIIQDQKITIHTLEEQLIPIRFEADMSSQNLTQNNMRVQQLQHECDHLQQELQKMKNKWEKSTIKNQKLEKELEKFKSWLGGAVGMRKVVDGCERVLMEEISNRLNNAKH